MVAANTHARRAVQRMGGLRGRGKQTGTKLVRRQFWKSYSPLFKEGRGQSFQSILSKVGGVRETARLLIHFWTFQPSKALIDIAGVLADGV